MKLKLVPGRYYAGFSRPFFISDGMIESKLRDMGGSNIRIFGRGAQRLPFDPAKADPGYKDDWDEVLTVEYHGKPRTEEVDKRWAWLARMAFSVKPPATPPATPPASRASPMKLGPLVLAWLLYEVLE